VLYSKLPYNLDKDIVPVAFFPSKPLIVGVPERLGITFKEWVQYAKQNPTNMGSYAPGSYRSHKQPDIPKLTEQCVEGRLVTQKAACRSWPAQVVVEGANTPRAAQLRETFAIPNKLKNLKDTRTGRERDVPVWIKLAVDLGVKLD
jgi:Tripartite tricarboxylate transporter family receptor